VLLTFIQINIVLLLLFAVQSDELDCRLVQTPAMYSPYLPPLMVQRKPTLYADIINVGGVDEKGGVFQVDIQASTDI
jgi:hypothetical protein